MTMMMVMVTIIVNICDDDCDLVIKVISVKEVMSCDVSPVAMFFIMDCNFCHWAVTSPRRFGRFGTLGSIFRLLVFEL